jgi:hypothetical protein
MGSRYWYPLTGHRLKKRTGTTIQHSSTRSRQVFSRRSQTRPPNATASTTNPTAAGTTVK